MEDQSFIKSAGSFAAASSAAAAAARAAQPAAPSRLLETVAGELSAAGMPAYTTPDVARLNGTSDVSQEPRKVSVPDFEASPVSQGNTRKQNAAPAVVAQDSWADQSAAAFSSFAATAPATFPPMYNPSAAMYGMYSPNPWGYMDPRMAGVMPGMFPGVPMGMGMVPMFPGMPGMPPQAAMPQAQFGGSAAVAGQKSAATKAKSRERRRRGKQKGAKDQAPSPVASDEADAAHSASLVEVRKHGNKCKLSLIEVAPDALELARDQHGSAFLQSKLDTASEQEKRALLNALVPEASTLSRTEYGSPVVSKLFDALDAAQKKELVVAVQGEVLALCKDGYGCRVIQSAIQHVSREAQLLLAEEIKQDVKGCIESMHGNHVIQKCIEQMPPDSVNFIIRAVEDDTENMAKNIYGCRVIQRLLEHCAVGQLERMLEQILVCVQNLAQDSFGNYVVQHMLEHGRVEDKRRIISVVRQNVVEFAKHRCSSNVVEKCFEISTIGQHAGMLDEERTLLMKSVLGEKGDPQPPLNQMVDDRFGNYIVQRMIQHSRGAEKEDIYLKLTAVEPQLRASTNGKHVLAALQKEFGSPPASS